MAVEIREVVPPRQIEEAMTRQMAAERNRRAMVAEGQKQAVILKAEGFALALNEIYKVAQGVDSKTMTLQYLEALKALGEGEATKFVIPTEFVNLVQPLVANAQQAHAEKAGS